MNLRFEIKFIKLVQKDIYQNQINREGERTTEQETTKKTRLLHQIRGFYKKIINSLNLNESRIYSAHEN